MPAEFSDEHTTETAVISDWHGVALAQMSVTPRDIARAILSGPIRYRKEQRRDCRPLTIRTSDFHHRECKQAMAMTSTLPMRASASEATSFGLRGSIGVRYGAWRFAGIAKLLRKQ
jgi:hypothetical protein